MTSTLQVKLLGPPEAYWEGKPVIIPRRYPKALLYFLAYRGSPVSRDGLLDLLWSEIDDSTARLRLNENLSRLRRSLPDHKLIISEGDLVGMDSDRVQVDAREFNKVIAQVGNLPWQISINQPLPLQMVQKLDDALAIWSGSGFIVGDVLPSTPELDSWLTRIGSHYEYHRLKIIERLAQHYFISGDYRQSQALAWEGIQMDKANQDLHLVVMKCLVNLGYLRSARKHYLLSQEYFQSDSSVEGSPEMDVLYAQLESGAGRKSKTAPKWKLHPSINTPFVGRLDALGQLNRCYHQQINVGILGESGSGKTRLVQEFTRLIQPPPRILVAVSKPYEASLPLQPIGDMLRESISSEEWQALSPVWASHLLRLLPELHTLRPELEFPTIPLNPEQAQATLLEAIRQVFLMIARDGSLVLVMDDLHWADKATIAGMVYFHSRPPFNQQSFLVGMGRQEELPQHLEDLLLSMKDDSQVIVLRLPGLDAQDISNLARFILNEEPYAKLVQNLWKATGGNTLYVLEVLREILDSDSEIVRSENFEVPLSENLLNLIEARIQKIDPTSRSILETAAILGPQFEVRMLAEVSSEPTATVVAALDRLEKQSILSPSSMLDHPDRYQFVHDKFWEALESMISPAKAAILHERVANLMAATYSPDQAAILAHHSQAAGLLLDAFHYWVETGSHALNLFSTKEAHNAFSQAENLIPNIESKLSADDFYDLYTTWLEMAYNIHQVQETDRLGTQLLAIGEKLQHPLLIGTALDFLSNVAFMKNEYHEGLDYVSRALPYLEKSGNVFRQMEALNHYGVMLYRQTRLSEALLAFEKALALAVDHDTPELDSPLAFTHFQLSLLHTHKGWPQKGMEHAEISLKAANRANRIYSRVSAYFVLTLSSYYLADFRQARNFVQAGIKLAEQAQIWRILGYLNSYSAVIDLTLGHADSALNQALGTIQLGERTDLSDVIAMGCRHAGDVYTRLGTADTAIQYYTRGADAGGRHYLGIDNLIHLGFVQCMSGQGETGHQILTNIQIANREIGLGLGILMAEFFQSLAYANEGKWEQAGHLAQKVMDTANRQKIPTYYYDAMGIMGRMALHNGDYEQAIELFKTIAEASRSSGNLWSELSAQSLLTQAYKGTKKPDPRTGNRFELLISRLEANTQSEALRGIFKDYRTSLQG